MPLGEERSLLRTVPVGALDSLVQFHHSRHPRITRHTIMTLAATAIIITANELFYWPAVDEYADLTNKNDAYRIFQKIGLTLGVISISSNAAYELVSDYLNNKAPGRRTQNLKFVCATALYSVITAATSSLVNNKYEFPLNIFIAALIAGAYFAIHTLSTRMIERISWLKATFLTLLFPPYLIYFLKNNTLRDCLFRSPEAKIHRDTRILLSAVERTLAVRFHPLNQNSDACVMSTTLRQNLGAGDLNAMSAVVAELYAHHYGEFTRQLRKVVATEQRHYLPAVSRWGFGLLGAIITTAASAGNFEAPIRLLRDKMSDVPSAAFWPLMYFLALMPDFIVFVLLAKYGGGLYMKAFDTLVDAVKGNFAWPLPFHLHFKRAFIMVPILLFVGFFCDAPSKLFILKGSSEGGLRDFFDFSAGMPGNGAFYMLAGFDFFMRLFESSCHWFGAEEDKLLLSFIKQVRAVKRALPRLSDADLLPGTETLAPPIPSSDLTAYDGTDYKTGRLYAFFSTRVDLERGELPDDERALSFQSAL